MGVPGIEINGDWSRWVILLAEQIGPFVFSGAETRARETDAKLRNNEWDAASKNSKLFFL